MFGKTIIAVSLAATALAQNTFSIATPAALVQCQPVAVSWTGGTAPFILAVVPGGQPSAAALETLSTSLTSSPYTWVVNIAAGTSVTLLITDSTGVSVGNSALTIQPGSSSACLNSSASTSGVATTGAITTTGSGSATLSGTSSATGVTTTRSSMMSMSSASASSSAAGAASSASTSSASRASSSTPASSGGAATSAASARPSGAALPNAAAGLPAIAAGVVGAVAMLF